MPYSFLPLSAQRPVITSKSAESAAMGAALTVRYSGTVTHAVIASPAAVTHQVGVAAGPTASITGLVAGCICLAWWLAACRHQQSGLFQAVPSACGPTPPNAVSLPRHPPPAAHPRTR